MEYNISVLSEPHFYRYSIHLFIELCEIRDSIGICETSIDYGICSLIDLFCTYESFPSL